MSIILF